MSKKELTKCPECGSLEVYYDIDGLLVCKRCGKIENIRLK